MVDPVKRPISWNPRFHVYAEQNGIYDVFQDLLKEMVIWKPEDALLYIKDELPRIAKSVYKPKVFLLGPEPLTPRIGENIARACGAKFLTLKDIIETSPLGIRDHLREYLKESDTYDEPLRKLLIATMSRRLAMEDCITGGYILFGFPQSRAQAMAAQMGGLLPRQIFALLPRGMGNQNEDVDSRNSSVDEDAVPKMCKMAEISLKDFAEYREYFRIKEVVSAFHLQYVKIIGHGRWSVSKPSDLEAEFLGAIITKTSRGAPWIPRVILIGPPASGKTKVAEHIAVTYNVTNVDWIDVVRGASLWPDEIAEEVKQYLADLTPMSDETIRILLQRKLGREDFLKKGWVLQGFPETKRHAQIMDELGMTGNRIFLLSCSEAVSRSRVIAKRQQIIGRRLPGIDYPSGITVPGSSGSGDEHHNIAAFPYSDYAIKSRCYDFETNLEEIIGHFGTEMIFVDATQPPNAVREFIDASVLRPPNIRF